MSLLRIHGFAAVAGGGHFVVGLGVGDREAEPTDGALVVDVDLVNVLRVGLFRAGSGEQVYGPHRHRKDDDGNEQGDYVLQLAEALDDRGVGEPAALAHGLQAVATTGALQLVEKGCHELGT